MGDTEDYARLVNEYLALHGRTEAELGVWLRAIPDASWEAEAMDRHAWQAVRRHADLAWRQADALQGKGEEFDRLWAVYSGYQRLLDALTAESGRRAQEASEP